MSEELRLPAMVRSLPVGVVVLDATGRVLAASDLARQCLGDPCELGRADLLGVLDERQPGVLELLFDPELPLGQRGPVVRVPGSGSEPVDLSVVPLSDGGAILMVEPAVSADIEAERVRLWQASHDPESSLPNRAAFLERVDQAVARLARSDGAAAVVLLRVGPSVTGSRVPARQLAEIAQTCVRAGDYVARVGDRDLGVLLEPVDGIDEAVLVTQRLFASLPSDATVGAGIHPLRRGETAEASLARVSSALGRAVESGSRRYEVFDAALARDLSRREQRKRDLDVAVERDELRLRFVPVTQLSDGSTAGVLARLRWVHPELGELRPVSFVDAAIESGRIDQIERWVLADAARSAAEVAQRWPGARTWASLSPLALFRAGFVSELETLLAAAGAPPASFGLEVPAGRVGRRVARVARVVRELADLGVEVGLGGFTGNEVKPADLVRLGVSTVRLPGELAGLAALDPAMARLLRAVTSLVHELGLTVVAGDVDGAEHEQAARDAGIRFAQRADHDSGGRLLADLLVVD